MQAQVLRACFLLRGKTRVALLSLSPLGLLEAKDVYASSRHETR